MWNDPKQNCCGNLLPTETAAAERLYKAKKTARTAAVHCMSGYKCKSGFWGVCKRWSPIDKSISNMILISLDCRKILNPSKITSQTTLDKRTNSFHDFPGPPIGSYMAMGSTIASDFPAGGSGAHWVVFSFFIFFDFVCMWTGAIRKQNPTGTHRAITSKSKRPVYAKG